MSTTTARSLDELRREVAGKRRTATASVTWAPESRSATGDLRVSGHAAVFESASEDMGFIETLAPGCFNRALSRTGADPYLLLGHDHNAILARRSAGTLELREDGHGLAFTADIVPTTQGKDVALLVKTGHLSGCSFAFTVAKGGDSWSMRDGVPHRRITEIGELMEITLTGNPAYKAASVRDRSEDKAALQRRIENTVKRHRLSRPNVTVCPYASDPDQSFYRDLLVDSMESERRRAAVNAGSIRMVIDGAVREVSAERAYASIGDPGFLRDRVHGGLSEARARLAQLGRHLIETRDLTTTNTDGGGFVPGNVTGAPQHVAAAFAAAVRARGVLPSIFPVVPLQPTGLEIGTAKLTTGVSVEAQATENTAPSEQEVVEAKVTSPVGTLIGFEDVSLQLLERAEPGADEWLAEELGRALAEELDQRLFTGSGTRPYPIGLDAVIAAGGTTTSYTDASPTRPEAWAAVAECAATVGTALGAPADVAIMHGRRLAWFGSWRDSAGSAPTPAPWGAIGLTPYACNSVSITSGSSTNEDRIYVARREESEIHLAPVRFEVMRQTTGLSEAGTVRVRAYRYYSTLFNRRPESLGVVAGTGLAGVTW